MVVRPLFFCVVIRLCACLDRPIGACAPLRAMFVYFNHLRGWWGSRVTGTVILGVVG